MEKVGFCSETLANDLKLSVFDTYHSLAEIKQMVLTTAGFHYDSELGTV